VLHHPRVPAIAGLDSFAGAAFHSARWDHSVPLKGARVAVIGTGSTGVQITTALAGVAERLYVMQRTPQWIIAVANTRYSRVSRALLARFPALSRASYRFNQRTMEGLLGRAVVAPGWQRALISRACRMNLRLAVRDPELRRRLTPSDEPMCRRLIMSAGFYPALQKPGVELVTDDIERIEPAGIRTVDGRLIELDVIVLATGFDAHAYVRPMEVLGDNGLSLEEAWTGGPRAYRTVAVPGFPNYFMLMGPHSPIGNHSLVAIAETQADFIVDWIERIRRGEIRSVAPTREATERFNADMRAAMPNTIWTSGCSSWYIGEDGLPELFPWEPEVHRELLAEPVESDFAMRV
jgi:cation diffusion facilitator CzcD-associated flavoprotein CzcO